jgi:hypothetical protein
MKHATRSLIMDLAFSLYLRPPHFDVEGADPLLSIENFDLMTLLRYWSTSVAWRNCMRHAAGGHAQEAGRARFNHQNE